MNRFYQSSEIAEYYIKYRPSYTKEVAQRVISFYYNDQPILSDQKLNLMVDVGCGSGQSTNIFQPYFDKILGIDTSLEQLKQAKLQNKFNNIEYVQGSAENIPVTCSKYLFHSELTMLFHGSTWPIGSFWENFIQETIWSFGFRKI